MKKILLVCATSIVALTGCMQQVAKIQPIDGFDNTIAVFKYQKVKADGTLLSKSTVCSSIQETISKSSGVRDKYTFQKKPIPGVSNTTTWVGGKVVVRLRDKGCKINVKYVNGEMITSKDYTKYASTVDLLINVSMTEDEKFLVAKLELPSTYSSKEGKSPLFMSYDMPLTDNKLKSELFKFSKIKPVVESSLNVTGEFNTKYPDNSVFANYKRTFGLNSSYSEVKNTDIGKKAFFNIGQKGKAQSVEVDVHPYRNGSKVSYNFFMAYTLNPDGTTTFSDENKKNIVSKIVAIAKD